jgi:hypothetical protein
VGFPLESSTSLEIISDIAYFIHLLSIIQIKLI